MKDIKFGVGDKIEITYKSRVFDIANQLGTIVNINPVESLPYMISLHDEAGKAVMKGHDNKGGGPGTGQYIFVGEGCMTLKEKYVSKFNGSTEVDIFRTGDSFVIKDILDITINNDPNESLGVTENQLARMRGGVHVVAKIIHIPEINLRAIVDGTYNYVWKPGWINKATIDPTKAPAPPVTEVKPVKEKVEPKIQRTKTSKPGSFKQLNDVVEQIKKANTSKSKTNDEGEKEIPF